MLGSDLNGLLFSDILDCILDALDLELVLLAILPFVFEDLVDLNGIDEPGTPIGDFVAIIGQ